LGATSGPVLVDFGARLRGSMSAKARIAALGHNHITMTALSYADPAAYAAYVAGNTPYRRQRRAYCVSLISDTRGTVTGHPGLERIRALPTFADAIAFASVGELVTPTSDLASTPGIVYLVGDREEDLRRD